MDGLGAEVSAKIRSAIKAKLIELEAYVDDELPDYIMVMVANNRTRTQMEEDLSLFLNNNTTNFCFWLNSVLEKLKKVTLEEVTKKEMKKKKIRKEKVKDAKEKSGKDPGRMEREDRRRREGKEKAERASGRARSRERKSSKPPPKGVPASKDNANLAELGPMKRKKKSSSGGLDGSGGAEGYNPASLLKSALGKTKENKASPKKSSKKRSSSSSKREKGDREVEREERKESEDRRSRSRGQNAEEKSPSKGRPKTIINLKEEENFYARDRRARDRSRSVSPRRTQVASLVSKVVRPPSLVSRSGRSERRRSRSFSPGAAYDIGYDPERESRRLASRAQLPPRPKRSMGRECVGAARVMGKAMMDSVTMSERRMGLEEARELDVRGRRAGPRLSPEDTRFEELRRRHEEMERRSALEERREGRGGARGRLAMDRESVRMERRDGIKEERVKEEPEEMRIIVRRELTPETVTPPKKVKLEEEDAELLEMRRKALESLMKRTDRELVGRRSSPRLRDESSESSSSESEDSTEESEEDNTKEEGEGGKTEPTFVVTLDGLDKKYFKSQGKGALELAREKMEPTALQAELKMKTKPNEKTSRVEKVKKESVSKMSSDGELELHPHEEFDEAPNTKKVVHKVTAVGHESTRPTMKVAARKRSPILATANGTKKVAEVKPVVSTVAAAPAKQLAGSYAARLTAIKAAKAAEASKQAASAAKKSEVETEPDLSNKSDNAPKTAPARAKITGPTPVAPKPVHKQVSAPASTPKDTPTVTKVKRTFTPIGAPSPDPVPPVSRFKSAPPAYPSKMASSSETICRFWPQCKWKDACAFKHPPIKGNPESVLATSSKVSKFKWSAK